MALNYTPYCCMHTFLQLPQRCILTTFRDGFVSAEPSSEANGTTGHSHHSHRPPPSPIFHVKWIISLSSGTHSLLRDFSCEPLADGWGKDSSQVPVIASQVEEEADRSDPWDLAPAGLASPRNPELPDISTPRTCPRSPVPGYPSGALFLLCGSPPCCQNGKACPYRLLTQAEWKRISSKLYEIHLLWRVKCLLCLETFVRERGPH